MMRRHRFYDPRPERAAQEVTAQYHRMYPNAPLIPCPIEEMLEVLYECYYDFKDFAKDVGDDTIVGALCCKEGEAPFIYITSELQPGNHPNEGRLRYTLAHELGHLKMHLEALREKANNLPLLPGVEARPIEFCRGPAEKSNPIEVEANYFASHILMPREAVFEVWRDMFGEDRGCMNVYHEIQERKERYNLKYDPVCNVACEFATIFKVSGQAMQNRLSFLGCINVNEDVQGDLGI